MAMEQSQIHTGYPTEGTEEQCRCASSSEGHDGCSDWEGMQPKPGEYIKMNLHNLLFR